jgi:8-oxo-dGTP pyrophosphatase MutT (NUDIX family)
MEEFAAGIIPYHLTSQGVYFLLGLEKSNNKWSGFVGGSEPYESIIQTAIREFNEETCLIFKDHLEYFYNKCLSTRYIQEITPSGKRVYLWFIELSYPVNLEQFSINQSLIEDPHFKEKSKLRWVSIEEIESSKHILYRLKSTILKNF